MAERNGGTLSKVWPRHESRPHDADGVLAWKTGTAVAPNPKMVIE